LLLISIFGNKKCSDTAKERIYYAIDNSVSASRQQDELLYYHSQRFNAAYDAKKDPVEFDIQLRI